MSEIEKEFQSAIQCYQRGELEQAESLMRKVVRKQPDDLKSLNFMGMILLKLKKFQPALEFFRKALSLSPLSADLHYNAGNVLKDSGRFDEAISYYERALQINPEHFESHNNLATIFQAKKQLDQAILHYQEALKRNPSLADAYYNLGTIVQEKKFINEAILFYQKCLQLDPYLYDAYYMLANIYSERGQLDDASAYFKQALKINPHLAKAYNGLGIVLQKKNDIDKAMAHYQQAITLMPDFIEAYVNMGNALRDYRFSEGAEYCYRQALSLAPECAVCYDNLFFLMLYNDSYNAETLFSEHLRFAEQCAKPLSSRIISHCNSRNPDRILKIGYISPDFRKHAVSYFTEPVLASHDKNIFEIFCYSDVLKDDAVTERFRQYAGQWRSISGMTDSQVDDLIRHDGIDILIDLAGHTAHNRLLVFARKPAPVQVTWIGYPATTGLATMDYKIVDIHTDPPGMTEQLYTENLLRMPESFLCYLPDPESPEVAPLPAIAAGYVTFGSFNNFAKVTPKVLTIWAEILRGVPNSRLIMKANSLADKTTAELVLDMFARNGIMTNRLELHGMIPTSGMHLDLYNRVDIGLDTFPYNGTTTTCEALWMGVPVVTLAGKTHASRVGCSLLSNAGLRHLVTRTHDEYKDAAIALAADTVRLESLRRSLRTTLQKSPLNDAERFVRTLEDYYRTIWRRWCAVA